MPLTLLHERKRPLLGRHLGDLLGKRIGAAFVRGTFLGIRCAPDIPIDGGLEERRVPDPIDRSFLLQR